MTESAIAATDIGSTGAGSRRARIGVQIAPQHAEYAQICRACGQLEDLGVDVALNWDHFFPLAGDTDGAHFECWTMLAAWAEATERIEIGRDPQQVERSAGVADTPGRYPEQVADYAANAQALYDVGSRLITTGLQQPPYDFGRVRDLIGWRDQVDGQLSPTSSA